MRLTGLGDAGLHGGPSGDLIVIVTVRPDAMFERDRFDVHVTVPVSYTHLDVYKRQDETRTQEFVRAVQFCPSPVASHARNHAARHRHVCSDDLLGKNIDHCLLYTSRCV